MKNVTIRDVANAAGVSAATVSRAINGTGPVTTQTRTLIENTVRKLGYELPETSPLRTQSSQLVFLFVRSPNRNAYARLLQTHMSVTAPQYNVRIVCCNADFSDDPNISTSDQLLSGIQIAMNCHACGLILSGFREDRQEPHIRELLRSCGLPVLYIDRQMSTFGVNRILTGRDRGAQMATQHMIEAGRRNLLVLYSARHRDMEEGFTQALATCANPNVHGIAKMVKVDNDSDSLRAVKEALEECPELDGILCYEDECAALVLRYLKQRGYDVPRQIELIGFNDNLAGLLDPPISSVQVPFSEICKRALDILLCSDPNSPAQTLLLDPQLILR